MGRKHKHDPTIEYTSINLRLKAETLVNIKKIVGQKMAENGIYMSQRDLLEKFIEEKIEEFAHKNEH
jgi:hypothetical protein